MEQTTWFVGGTIRSGSTLLAGLLSEATRGVNVGELHILWRSFALQRVCTCSARLADCELWGEVATRVLSRMQLSSTSDAAEIEAREPSQRSVLVSGTRVRIPVEVLRLRAETESAVRAVMGRGVIVDSSKVAGTLSVAFRVDPNVQAVHLVRDPRAVAYSMSHPKADPSRQGRMLPAAGPMRASAEWLLTNLAHERLAHAEALSASRVRYESFVGAPRQAVENLVSDVSNLDRVELSSHGEHAIAGNPWRFEPSRELRLDRRWEKHMSKRDRWLTTSVTVPLLGRYGYSLTGQSR